MMQCSRKLKVTDLNPHLICVLCGGYYVDATTIIECLHSFCKSCIVKYLETNKYCPICDVQVHKTRPLQNIRPDDTLQTIVYKLVPGLYQNEMRCRRDFYAKHPEAKVQVPSPEARGELTDQSRIFLPEEPVSLCLEYVGAPNNNQPDQQGIWGRRYLRCPAAVSISHLHKLIRAKFGLAMGHKVDVFYKEDILPNNWTLMDIAYIYQWKRKSPIHLSYQILENQRKRIKLSHDSVPGNESSSSEMETLPIPDENSDGKSLDNGKQQTASDAASLAGKTPADISDRVSTTPKEPPVSTAAAAMPVTSSTVTKSSNKANVEWKEVQLQISENGIMSVAGVETERLLTSMQPISVSSQNENAESAEKISVDNKSNVNDEKLSENKVPPVDSDSNLSALQEKNVKCDSRTKPIDAPAKCDVAKSENNKDAEAKTVTKDVNNHIDSFKRDNKCSVGYKLPNNSDKTNAIFKSKTDKLEDAVRNIANRTEPAGKSDNASKSHHVLTASSVGKEVIRPKTVNSESSDSLSGGVHRPLTLTPKVYPGIKPPVYNSLPKEEVKINNKPDPLGTSNVKQTPMEILNTHNKLQNHMVKYKSHKASLKPWNPSISRAAVLAMKHAPPQLQSTIANKDSNSAGSTENQQLNPPPVKQPRFFKIRNMPRFLGNPASGVKPMYQVAPGSEIVAGNTSVSTPPAVTCMVSSAISSVPTTSASATGLSNTHGTVSSAVPATVPNIDSSTSTVTTSGSLTTTPSVGITYSAQKVTKQSSSPSLTLMKIDPKTLSPITMNPATVSHVLNNPPRTASSSQQKKLPPPFTPGSPKHSNHYTNCRTAHTNGSKNSVPRTPSPAHTGGLIPTHPFIPVSHANPHLLYSAFPNPFSPTDPTGNRLLPGPTNSELIQAMSALCSSGSAFHPSLPPSISMLFNPHHAHHRTLPTERTNFKCNSNDKKATQSPPPTVQRVPPSNQSSKGFNESDVQHINMNSVNADQTLNPSRSKKTKTEHPSSLNSLPVKSPKQIQLNSPGYPTSFSPSSKKLLPDNSSHQLATRQSNSVSVPNCVENKKSVSSNLPKLPGEKIEEITSELSVQNQKAENKPISKEERPTAKVTSDVSVTGNESSFDDGKLKFVDKQKEIRTVNNNNEVKNADNKKSKDEQLNSINNNNNINKASNLSIEDKSDVDRSPVVNNKNT